jgi:hypothetical protein
MTAGTTVVSFDITTVTNPTDTDATTGGTQIGTFYARILTYAAGSGATGYVAGTPGTYIDYGGIALSLANQLTITAKVQESLTFCVYVSGSNCSGGTGTALALGDGNGVLAAPATTYTSTAKFGLASNAQGGVTVRMKGTTLTSGSNTIDPTGGGTTDACTADVATTTVEQFGMRVTTTAPVTAWPGTGSTPRYDCAATNHNFNVDATDGTASTYGGNIASTVGALDETQVPMEFAAKAATATEAGIYTTALTFIATGVY